MLKHSSVIVIITITTFETVFVAPPKTSIAVNELYVVALLKKLKTIKALSTSLINI